MLKKICLIVYIQLTHIMFKRFCHSILLTWKLYTKEESFTIPWTILGAPYWLWKLSIIPQHIWWIPQHQGDQGRTQMFKASLAPVWILLLQFTMEASSGASYSHGISCLFVRYMYCQCGIVICYYDQCNYNEIYSVWLSYCHSYIAHDVIWF